MDAVALVTGTHIQQHGIPVGMRSVDIPDGMVEGNDFLALFGRPKRQSACECERSSNVTFSHALSLINGDVIGVAVGDASSRLNQFVRDEKDNAKVIDEIYYSGNDVSHEDEMNKAGAILRAYSLNTSVVKAFNNMVQQAAKG